MEAYSVKIILNNLLNIELKIYAFDKNILINKRR